MEWVSSLLLLIALTYGLGFAIVYGGVWWVQFGILTGFALSMFILSGPLYGINWGNYKNTRFTTSPEIKRRAADAIKVLIPYWRANAFLRGETTYCVQIRTLTMREIKEVYPHVKQRQIYNVEFDFGAEKSDV